MNTYPEPQDTQPDGEHLARPRRVRRHWMTWLVVPMLLLDGCTGARTERTICGPDAEPACIRRAVPCVNERPRPALGTHQQAAPCFG
jgi:hypothetical protein